VARGVVDFTGGQLCAQEVEQALLEAAPVGGPR
jgi:hypothetical protein